MTEEPLVVRGRSGLLAATPALLGFHPQESMVLICLGGPRRRVGPVARADLDDRRAAAVLARYGRDHADEVVLLVYARACGPWLLVEDTTRRLEWAGVPLLDVVHVRGARARSLRRPPPTREQMWFSVPDADHPDSAAIAGRLVLSERAVLPDRAALVASVEGPGPTDAAAAEAAVEAVLTGVVPRLTDDGGHALLLGQLTAAADAGLREVAGAGAVSLTTAAALAVLTCDVLARDALIARVVGETDVGWTAALVSAAARIPDREATGICAALAVCAYRHGDGALAQVALDRVFAVEPDHRLGRLLSAAMTSGLAPDVLGGLAEAGAVRTGTDG